MKQLPILICILFWLSGSLIGQPCNEPPAADNCESAPLICDLDVLNGYCTSMEDNQTGNGPTPFCENVGVPNNPIWVAFYAGCPTLTMTISVSNCVGLGGSFGIQAGIFGYDHLDGCTNSYDIPDEYIDCAGTCPMVNDDLLLHADGLQVGKVYYLVIDGCAGSYCDISISVAESCDPPHIEDWELEPLTGPTTACTGSTTTYSVQSPVGAILYHWSVDSLELPNQSGDTLDIQWAMAGTFELCVDVSNPCVPASENPIPQCMTVTVTDVVGDDPVPVVICSDDTYSYGGSQYPPGVHDVVLITPEGCDSLVTLIVNSTPDQQTDLGYFYLCDGDILNIGNTSLSCNNEGPQEVVLSQSTYPFCDSILSFNILCLSPDAYVFDPPILAEGVDTVELDGGNSLADPPFFPTYFDWYMVDTTSWQWVGDSSIYLATELGMYCLVFTIISPDSIAICSDTACVVVDSIKSAIQPVTNIGQWQISPVPAREILTVQCQGAHCPSEGILECWDVHGRKVKEIRVEHSATLWEFSVANWPTGPYWITWRKDGLSPVSIGVGLIQR